MTEQRKNQLFDSMLSYVGEIVGKNDLVDALRAIGLTEEEIADIVEEPKDSACEFIVKCDGKTYNFEFGYEAMIFDHGVENHIATDELIDFVQIVSDCYIKDENPTPLGHLADFVAENWEDAKKLSLRDILCGFYNEIGF